MKYRLPLESWEIKKCNSVEHLSPEAISSAVRSCGEPWIASQGARQVHDILLSGGIISDSIKDDGNGEYCKWVSDFDWAYQCKFQSPDHRGKVILCFDGLDTVTDIFLNGKHLGTSETMYLPYRYDVSGSLHEENELLVYFHRHKKILSSYEKAMPEAWRGNVPARAMLRKAHDYGARDEFSPIGLFDDVYLEMQDGTYLDITDMNVTFDVDRTQATVAAHLQGPLCEGFIETEFVLEEENGSHRLLSRKPARLAKDHWSMETTVKVSEPRLWWPKNYGNQPLYRATFRVYIDGVVVDETVKMIGLRDVRLIGSMKFEVNGTVVRFWGANIAPIWGLSNRFNREVTLDLIDKADKGNINALRVWGPNKPYPDDLYDECDRRGIMVWQDFPTGGSQLPDSPEYKKLFLDEAEHMIRRLKHHPSIMLWCGGNENIYMCELFDKKSRIGFEMLTHGYRSTCLALDPQRYYHTSCPAEGRYTNDPTFGDSHGSRALRSYIAGEQYGIFYSENIRVYPPQYKSFKKIIKEEIWEDGYVDTKPYGCAFPMPNGWRKRLGNHGERKFGPIGDYYSATNAKELIYKYTAAAGQDIYDMLTRSRKGNPAHKSHEERTCTGHMMWKLNDPWPNFYCAFIDYYGECGIPYYAAKRAFAPVMVHFEVADHIYLWGINDTSKDVVGTIEVKLYDLEELEAVKKEFTIPATVLAGESKIITNLDRLGFFFWESVLHATFKDSEGNVVSTAYGYVTKENMLPFHDAVLSMRYENGYVYVTTDKFARCIELSGDVDGDEFGWFFEDNYFDLLPFETKKIRLYGNHPRGSISAKAQYSTQSTTIQI